MLQAGDPLPEGAPEGTGSAGSADEHLAAFDEAVAEIAARVEPAYGQAGGWLERIRAGLLELLRFCDEQPDTARELVVESVAWGAAVLKRRMQLLDALAEAIDLGRAEIVATDAPRPGTAENLVGACVSLVHTRLLQDRDRSFMELSHSLMSMIAHPYLGSELARHELERPLTHAAAQPAAHASDASVARFRERAIDKCIRICSYTPLVQLAAKAVVRGRSRSQGSVEVTSRKS